MNVLPTELPGVVIIEPDVFKDDRGFFFENYHLNKYRDAEIGVTFVQDNHSRSLKNTLRGLHTQLTHPQGKLIRVIQGAIYDVAVDIRKGSPTFKKWVSMELSAANFRQCYVPPGFAHGFCVLTESAEVEYKVTDFYDPKGELTILWNDPELAIPWPIKNPVLSPKDQKGKRLADAGSLLPIFAPPK